MEIDWTTPYLNIKSFGVQRVSLTDSQIVIFHVTD